MRRKLVKPEDLYTQHIGHTVIYYSGGLKQGKVLRVTYREDVNAYSLWLEATPFPIQIFHDQLKDCQCKHEKKEWTPDRDYH